MDEADFGVEAMHHARELMWCDNDVAVALPHDPVFCLVVGGQQVVDLGIPRPALLGWFFFFFREGKGRWIKK